MSRVFLSVFTFSGLIVLCVAVPAELEEDKVNCTIIGVATICCETHGCAFINCTDGMRCEDARNITALGRTCATAVNTCLEILANSKDSGSTIDPWPNITTLLPMTTFPDNTTNSTLTPDTTTSSHNPTGNVSSATFEPITGKTSVTPNVTETMATQEDLTTAKHSTETVNVFTSSQPLSNSTSNSTTSTQPELTCKRHFDTASFIGGMVFLLGIAGIGGFVYMYYKSQRDASYRTL